MKPVLTQKRKEQLRKANRDYRSRRRARLLAFLGGRCVTCGTEENLSFDHIHNDRAWNTRKLGSLQRLVMLEKEAEVGVLQILCLACNTRKQRNREPGPFDEVAAFFDYIVFTGCEPPDHW